MASSSSAAASEAGGALVSSSGTVFNVNIGVLGHVDSGKTSLVKALCTHLSTASLDKTPQSQARGMTLDLGFSAFFAPIPPHLQEQLAGVADKLQFTLVDCPGHASLIRTIIGGAQIIDLMFLVIDVTKGIQTQTAECLVIGEILTDTLIIVLNKLDLLTEPDKQLPKMKAKLAAVFKATKFGENVPIVCVSANPGGAHENLVHDRKKDEHIQAVDYQKGNVQGLINHLLSTLQLKPRDAASTAAPFLFSVDHCFKIQGQGTVLTGTCLSGSVKVGDMIEVASLNVQKKIKSMQMFRKPVHVLKQGDRAGICVTQLDSDAIERELLCTPGSLSTFTHVIAAVDKIRFFKGKVGGSRHKFHVSIGHSTTTASTFFFTAFDNLAAPSAAAATDGADSSTSSSSSSSTTTTTAASSAGACAAMVTPLPLSAWAKKPLDFTKEYVQVDELQPSQGGSNQISGTQFVLLSFDKPIKCSADSMLIGSRLDTDINLNSCRLAFIGRMLQTFDVTDAATREQLKIVSFKERTGVIDRVETENCLIGRDLFSKDTDLTKFLGLTVHLMPSGTKGKITSSFGKGGKFKCEFPTGIPMKPASVEEKKEEAGAGADGKGKKKKEKEFKHADNQIVLRLKKYMNAINKKELLQ